MQHSAPTRPSPLISRKGRGREGQGREGLKGLGSSTYKANERKKELFKKVPSVFFSVLSCLGSYLPRFPEALTATMAPSNSSPFIFLLSVDRKHSRIDSIAGTVTRLDVIFRYTDRVPLTHFVHRAKKVFKHVGLNFLFRFLRHRNFPAV
jgi:hypothetical protein